VQPTTPAPRSAADATPAERAGALAPMLADPDPRVRKSAVIALGHLACPESSAQLCRMLADPVEGVRVLACQALGRVADPACVPALLERVHDDSVEVRSGVLWALANVVAHGDLDESARAALFTPVMVLAFDPSDAVRADAAAVIGSLRDPRATDALLVLLEDACPRVRANAAASLGLTDDAPGLEALLSVAENPGEDPLARVSAVDGIARRASRGSVAAGQPCSRRAVDAALLLADSPQAELAQTATWALGMMAHLVDADLRPAVTARLDAALRSPDEWVARYAAESLARLHDDAAHAALAAFAQTPEAQANASVAEVVAKALATF